MADVSPDRVPVLGGPLYISIDLDGLDPSAAPGVAHPEPGGLTVRELLAVLHKQTAPIVGADIVELHPGRDIGGVTAILGRSEEHTSELQSLMRLPYAVF